MLQFSRFTHVFELGDAVALYHSLRMKPVFLAIEDYRCLQEWLASTYSVGEASPLEIRNIVDQLRND